MRGRGRRSREVRARGKGAEAHARFSKISIARRGKPPAAGRSRRGGRPRSRRGRCPRRGRWALGGDTAVQRRAVRRESLNKSRSRFNIEIMMRTTEAMSPSVPLAMRAHEMVTQARRRPSPSGRAGRRRSGPCTPDSRAQGHSARTAGKRLRRHERVGAKVHCVERAGRGHDDEELAGERHHRDDDVCALGERECEGVGAVELQPERAAKGRAGDKRSRSAQIVEDGRGGAVPTA